MLWAGANQSRDGSVRKYHFYATVYGKWGHAARPDLNIVPILTGTVLIRNIHGLKLENSQIISVTKVNSGCGNLQGNIKWVVCHKVEYYDERQKSRET